VGVVFVKQRTNAPAIKQLSTNVYNIFADVTPRILRAKEEVDEALSRLHNVLAATTGLYKALDHIAPGTELTVVHDYEEVAVWLDGHWKANDPLITRECRSARSALMLCKAGESAR